MTKYIIIIGCVCLSLASCVSSKKFSDLEVLKEYYKLKNDTLELLRKENYSINRSLSNTSSDLSATKADLSITKSALGELQSKHDQLQSRYRQLEQNNQKLSSSSKSETATLNRQLSQAKSENEQIKSILTNLDKTYQINQNGAVLSNDSWSSKLSRMQDVSQTIDAERSQIESLYGLILESPLSLEKGIEVLYSNNKLTFRMQADEVFRSGSSQLNTKGRNFVEELTGILLRNSNLNVDIEGHSDSKGSDTGNWNMSSDRATAVAKEMIKHQFMPGRISAIGKSSHHPINFETSTAALKQNRRVELIIKPRTRLN